MLSSYNIMIFHRHLSLHLLTYVFMHIHRKYYVYVTYIYTYGTHIVMMLQCVETTTQAGRCINKTQNLFYVTIKPIHHYPLYDVGDISIMTIVLRYFPVHGTLDSAKT